MYTRTAVYKQYKATACFSKKHATTDFMGSNSRLWSVWSLQSLTLLCFFCLWAARVRVPGGSPFSQLILHETNKSKVVTHIVATSNSLSSIHLTPNQGYHWLELKSKPENFSNLSEASFLNPSRNGIARLMPDMIQLFSCRGEPRVRSIRHVKSQVRRLPSKAVSQSHVCSNLIWITNPKRKVQLPSRQKNEMSSTSWIFTSLQNTLSFQLANLKSWR